MMLKRIEMDMTSQYMSVNIKRISNALKETDMSIVMLVLENNSR